MLKLVLLKLVLLKLVLLKLKNVLGVKRLKTSLCFGRINQIMMVITGTVKNVLVF